MTEEINKGVDTPKSDDTISREEFNKVVAQRDELKGVKRTFESELEELRAYKAAKEQETMTETENWSWTS